MKVLVVEDEYYLRKSLIKVLEQLGGIQIIGECKNGTEAVEFLKEARPDLVLTDIRMPEMDGLELSEYICDHFPDVMVVIETGYADFSYAQRAIRYGVKNYLLKPIKDSELAEVIRDAGKRMREESRSISRKVNQRALLYMAPEDMMKNEELCSQLLDEYTGKLNEKYWIMIDIRRNGIGMTQAWQEAVREKFGEECCASLYFKRSDEFILFIFRDTEQEWQDKKYVLDINCIIDNQKEKETDRITAGSSRIYHSGRQLFTAYEDCKNALNRRLTERRGGLYEFAGAGKAASLLSQSMEINLYESIASYDYPMAKREIERLFDIIGKTKPCSQGIQSTLFHIYSVMHKAHVQRKENQEEMHKDVRDFRIDLSAYNTLEELKRHILEMFQWVCMKNQKKAEQKTVEKMLEYIERNYAYDISLNELAANYFFMNANYMSRLFKMQTGDNFSKYLIKYRIEKAKKLLEDTNLKVTEIAACTGFNTSSHFGYMFKKYTDCTPEVYRKISRDTGK